MVIVIANEEVNGSTETWKSMLKVKMKLTKAFKYDISFTVIIFNSVSYGNGNSRLKNMRGINLKRKYSKRGKLNKMQCAYIACLLSGYTFLSRIKNRNVIKPEMTTLHLDKLNFFRTFSSHSSVP